MTHDDQQGVLRHRLQELHAAGMELVEQREEARATACRLEERLHEVALDCAIQFGYWSDSTGGLWTGGLSTLEMLFGVLGWEDPHPMPELRCDESGCLGRYTCGWNSPTGYRRTCGHHMRRAEALLSGGDADRAPGVVHRSG